MVGLLANSGDPDQTTHSTASDLGRHCLPITLLRVSRLQRVKEVITNSDNCLCYVKVNAMINDAISDQMLRCMAPKWVYTA